MSCEWFSCKNHHPHERADLQVMPAQKALYATAVILEPNPLSVKKCGRSLVASGIERTAFATSTTLLHIPAMADHQ